jgi:DeoR/GlpR family transcriptional regulator of sugar metabolism
VKNERTEALLELLKAGEVVRVGDLAQTLGVSEMTVRRDLNELEALGSVKRVHGGAVRAAGRAFDQPYSIRAVRGLAEKRAIAAEAARHVRDGDAIALDTGSTVLQMTDYLDQSQLTIVTANLRTAWSLVHSRRIGRPFRLVLPGGLVREDELALIGEDTVNRLSSLRVDIAFLGVAGVNAAAGLTDFNLEDAGIKRVLVEAAKRTIVLVDGSKLGVERFVRVAQLRQVDLLITDTSADPEIVAELREAGLEVVEVEPLDESGGASNESTFDDAEGLV